MSAAINYRAQKTVREGRSGGRFCFDFLIIFFFFLLSLFPLPPSPNHHSYAMYARARTIYREHRTPYVYVIQRRLPAVPLCVSDAITLRRRRDHPTLTCSAHGPRVLRPTGRTGVRKQHARIPQGVRCAVLDSSQTLRRSRTTCQKNVKRRRDFFYRCLTLCCRSHWISLTAERVNRLRARATKRFYGPSTIVLHTRGTEQPIHVPAIAMHRCTSWAYAAAISERKVETYVPCVYAAFVLRIDWPLQDRQASRARS